MAPTPTSGRSSPRSSSACANTASAASPKSSTATPPTIRTAAPGRRGVSPNCSASYDAASSARLRTVRSPDLIVGSRDKFGPVPDEVLMHVPGLDLLGADDRRLHDGEPPAVEV